MKPTTYIYATCVNTGTREDERFFEGPMIEVLRSIGVWLHGTTMNKDLRITINRHKPVSRTIEEQMEELFADLGVESDDD